MQSCYTDRATQFGVLSKGNHVLDRGAHCRLLVNTIEPSMCGGDAALCQITLTTCNYYHHRSLGQASTALAPACLRLPALSGGQRRAALVWHRDITTSQLFLPRYMHIVRVAFLWPHVVLSLRQSPCLSSLFIR